MKKSIAVIFGGASSEHEVSRLSVMTILSNLPKEKYDVHIIGITKNGEWFLYYGDIEKIRDGRWENSSRKVPAFISPSSGFDGITVIRGDSIENVHIDCVFPVLHGKNGEDGTIQGLFELAKIPYVGCGVLASAVSMDKAYTKIIVDSIGDVRQAEYVLVDEFNRNDLDSLKKEAEEKLGYPMFVKPCKAGSSQGVSKVVCADEFVSAVKIALEHDTKVLIEEGINGREIECAVIKRNGEIKASDVGEILAGDVFYSYDAKYANEDSKTITNPQLPEGKLKEVREKAVKIFKAVDGDGLSRVDFFLENETNEIVFNEINTLPGFTPISMYPMLMNAKGLPTNEIVDMLIEEAIEKIR